MRWAIVLSVFLLFASYGCNFSCNLGGTPDFAVSAEKTNVSKDGAGVTTSFALRVDGPKLEEKDGQNHIDVEIAMTVKGPDGKELKLPGDTTQRMQQGYDDKITFIEMKPHVQLPHNAPKGEYVTTFNVTDHNSGESETVDVKFNLD